MHTHTRTKHAQAHDMHARNARGGVSLPFH
nr:MAG TPA: hypothetical protein [Caudoviricetes sp.]